MISDFFIPFFLLAIAVTANTLMVSTQDWRHRLNFDYASHLFIQGTYYLLVAAIVLTHPEF